MLSGAARLTHLVLQPFTGVSKAVGLPGASPHLRPLNADVPRAGPAKTPLAFCACLLNGLLQGQSGLMYLSSQTRKPEGLLTSPPVHRAARPAGIQPPSSPRSAPSSLHPPRAKAPEPGSLQRLSRSPSPLTPSTKSGPSLGLCNAPESSSAAVPALSQQPPALQASTQQPHGTLGGLHTLSPGQTAGVRLQSRGLSGEARHKKPVSYDPTNIKF